MRPVLAQRVAGFGTSIFSEMTALAVRHQAVNLGQGFPDFAAPDFVKQAAADAIAANMNQYAPAPGLPALRQALAQQWQRDYGQDVAWETDITITSGATEALCDAMLALLNPGERAIVFEPAYDAYVPDLTLAGAEPVLVRLRPPAPDAPPSGLTDTTTAWWFDADELRAAFAERPRLLLLNSPHNPTGKVFTRAELDLIATLCQEYDVVAICDEVYDRLVFDDARHLPLATLPGMWERTLTIGSFGKTFSATGWKIGWGIGPAHLNHALRQAHQWVTFATATPFQQAAAVAITSAHENGYYARLQQEYDERRGRLRAILEAIGLPTLPTEGAYFISADIRPLGFSNDVAFCRMLTERCGVAAIPTSAFYRDPTGTTPLARFCFAKSLETIDTASTRLLSFQQQMKGSPR